MMNELSNITLDRAAEILESSSCVLILTHASPDADTLGSGFALRELLRRLGKKAEVINPEQVPKSLKFIFGEESPLEENLPENYTPDLIVAVDVPTSKRLGILEEKYASACALAIDHHALGVPFARETYVGKTGSTGEIIADIFELFEKKGKKLMTRPAATALYAAICSDTGSFKYDSVTPQTHIRIAHLMEMGINHSEIARRLYDSRPMTQVLATKLALNTLKLYHNGKIAGVHFTQEMLLKNGLTKEDIENIIDLTRGIEGVEVGFSVKQSEKDPRLFKVSMRSNRVADVAKLCALFGGGGHIRAGGCTVNADTVKEAEEILVNAISKELARLEDEGAFEGAGEL